MACRTFIHYYYESPFQVHNYIFIILSCIKVIKAKLCYHQSQAVVTIELYPTHKMKILPKIYRALFFLACFSFVSWQSYLSFAKFLKRPRSTSSEIDKTKNWPLPQIYFCPSRLKLEPLEECNLTE